jgi:hypothetical protein
MSNVSFQKKAKGDKSVSSNSVQTNSPNTKSEKIALYSSKNVHWTEVGKLVKGFNIVSSEKAESWLTLDGVRIASPEEIAREYGI